MIREQFKKYSSYQPPEWMIEIIRKMINDACEQQKQICADNAKMEVDYSHRYDLDITDYVECNFDGNVKIHKESILNAPTFKF